MEIESEDNRRTGLFCFLNCERECGADCMGFMIDVPDGQDYKTPDGVPRQWARCMLLVNAHRLAKHSVLLTKCSEESLRLAKALAADQQRAQPTIPTNPIVGMPWK